MVTDARKVVKIVLDTIVLDIIITMTKYAILMMENAIKDVRNYQCSSFHRIVTSPALGKEKGESILATEELMNDTMKKKYFTTFTNLVSGQEYFVKTLYNIEYNNQHNLLESLKESFTTACHCKFYCVNYIILH
ncbi:hypothetical protein G9C98_001497 [Cotesia typhae]|uniref:Uncharacterized protein n=1 Tax=Cotesia typhae TaxID=2053667 RepID=A0A8J5R0G2_9HYME|nr:hypothetical protein G9C98_001497 [Cotesia typhae]